MYDLPTTMPADVVGTLDQVPDLAAYFPSKTKGKHQTMPAQPASADGPAGADAPPTPPALDRQVAQQCRGGRPSRTLSRSRRHKLLLVAHRTRVAVALDDAAYVPTRHPVAVSPSASLMLTRATPCAASQITCAPHLALRKIATLNAALPTLLTDVNGWRKAMDSRVHRAGVACPVHVETLAAAPDLLSLPDHMLAEFLVALPRASFNALVSNRSDLYTLLRFQRWDELVWKPRFLADYVARGRGGKTPGPNSSWRKLHRRFSSVSVSISLPSSSRRRRRVQQRG